MKRAYKIGVDTKTYDLAEHFLNDIDKSQYQDDIAMQLAMIIQQEIEAWLQYDLPHFIKNIKET